MKTAVDSLAAAINGHLALPLAHDLRERDLDIHHFPQIWSNTACMHSRGGMIAGQAITRAYTTVIFQGATAYVHCDGARVYQADASCPNFVEDMATRRLETVGAAATRYRDFMQA